MLAEFEIIIGSSITKVCSVHSHKTTKKFPQFHIGKLRLTSNNCTMLERKE
jgi:hypothetical protein